SRKGASSGSLQKQTGVAKGKGRGTPYLGAADFDAVASHVSLRLRDGVFAKVEDAGGQHRIRATFLNTIDQMLQIAHPTGSDHRNRHRITQAAGQAQIKAILSRSEEHTSE